ncbi:MAG: hypothetical protein WDM94_01285 [Bauldia sp.]
MVAVVPKHAKTGTISAFALATNFGRVARSTSDGLPVFRALETAIRWCVMHLAKQSTRPATLSIVSARLKDDGLVELIVAQDGSTAFAVSKGADWRIAHEVIDAGGQRLVPYSRDNSLIRNRVVLFPEAPLEYGTKADLLASIALYIDRYVDLSPAFLRLAAHYVLLSWVHDSFNELPYLRLRGEFGTGKTRFLLVVGSIC